MQAYREAVDWWGKWRVDVNTVTKDVNTGYTVGSSAPQNENVLGVFAPPSSPGVRRILANDWWRNELRTAVTLRNSWISNAGIDPIGGVPTGDGPEGVGTCDLGSNILRSHEPVRWVHLDWTGVQK